MSLGSNEVEASGQLSDKTNIQKANTFPTKKVSDSSNALSVCSAITDVLSSITDEVISQKGKPYHKRDLALMDLASLRKLKDRLSQNVRRGLPLYRS